jgi:hypothetical protein
LLEWRKCVFGALMSIFILPTSAMAQDLGRAMLHSDGGTWLNGHPAPNSSVIFPHDLVQTRKESTAKIDANGSTVTIQPGTRVQFEEEELFLDSGSLQVNSGRGLRVRVDCMTVIPPAQGWTRYDVVDADGKLKVVAYENDVEIHYRHVAARQSKKGESADVTVHRGEQVTREEQCRADYKPAEAIDAKGAILNSPWAKGAGIAAVSVITCWVLCPGDPISPALP